ncbi:hypothetical protein AX16_007588 [Volvariella volvacea WC 439]|nr:hypothetical protein AX16_007588 [Volvariella volvacea WC 439]
MAASSSLADLGQSHQLQYFPINELPVEVLCRVFKHAIQRRSTWEDFLRRSRMGYVESPDFSPTMLTHICQHWRRVALAEPTLWSIIKATGASENTFQHVQLYLARSGNSCPLDITYTSPASIESSITQKVLRLTKLFVDNISRWRTINFTFHVPDHCKSFSAIPLNSSTSLISATLHFRSVWSLSGPFDVWNTLQSAQALVELRVLNPMILRYPAPQWNSITHLLLPPLEPNLLRDILRKSPNLTELWASLSGGHETSETLILLPKLLTLYPNLGSGSRTNSFLRIIQAPSLEHLHISHSEFDPMGLNLDDLDTFLSRSGCNLKGLSLNDFHIPDYKLAGGLCSARLASLEELRLRGLIGDNTIQALTLSEDGQGACSRLKRLELFRCKTSRDGLIGNCIRSRATETDSMVVAKVQMERTENHDYARDIQILAECDDPSRSISCTFYELEM